MAVAPYLSAGFNRVNKGFFSLKKNIFDQGCQAGYYVVMPKNVFFGF